MKTQIIQLEKNEDYISIRDKMGWNQTGRMLLVFPPTGHVLHRKLDLMLIKRHASFLGTKLALVARDAEVRFNAHQLGIPVYKNMRDAREKHWRVPRQTKQTSFSRRNQPRFDNFRKPITAQQAHLVNNSVTRIISFIIAVLSVFALAVFILPGATITIAPHVSTQSLTIPVYADPSLTEVNHSTGGLPVDYLEVIVEGSDTTKTTGKTLIPDRFATGSVGFKNISSHPMHIPPHTVVTTLGDEPIRFLTTSVDAISISPGETEEITVKAEIPGTTGNLPAGELVAVEGEIGLDLTVTNQKPTYGGADASVPAPGEADYELLRSGLILKLEDTALTEMQSQLSGGDTLITPTIQITEIVEETASPSIGEPGGQFFLFLRLKYQVQVVKVEAVNSLIEPILAADIPAGTIPLKDTLELVEKSEPIINDEGKARWTIGLERKLQPEFFGSQIINQVKGLTIKEAEARLSNALTQTDDVAISLTPAWWPRLPFLPLRIQIEQLESQ